MFVFDSNPSDRHHGNAFHPIIPKFKMNASSLLKSCSRSAVCGRSANVTEFSLLVHNPSTACDYNGQPMGSRFWDGLRWLHTSGLSWPNAIWPLLNWHEFEPSHWLLGGQGDHVTNLPALLYCKKFLSPHMIIKVLSLEFSPVLWIWIWIWLIVAMSLGLSQQRGQRTMPVQTASTWRLIMCRFGLLTLTGHSTEVLFYVQKVLIFSGLSTGSTEFLLVPATSAGTGGVGYVYRFGWHHHLFFQYLVKEHKSLLSASGLEGLPLQVLQELGDTGPCLTHRCDCDPSSSLALDMLQSFSVLLNGWVPDDAGKFQAGPYKCNVGKALAILATTCEIPAYESELLMCLGEGPLWLSLVDYHHMTLAHVKLHPAKYSAVPL